MKNVRLDKFIHKPPVRLGQSVPKETIKSVRIKPTVYLPKLSNPATTPSSSTMGNNCSCDRINHIQKQLDDLEKVVSNQVQTGRQEARVERRQTVTKPAPPKRPVDIEVITLSDSDSDVTVDWEVDIEINGERDAKKKSTD